MEPLQINPFVVDRKSRYAVTAFPVASEADFAAGLKALLKGKKFRAADHNIVAYRIKRGPGRIVEYKNDGYQSPSKESGAGIMVLDLMRQKDIANWCLVVTRWYGGVHLGADRFKHVRDAAAAIIRRLPA
ncbi:MAG: YigZ family protein [Candidatus Edwardsbacteria bacterium]|jgi:putative IMPACT (imprinted ancient) family translation regulator|nr:YigZ family protein [Candidatus Edwardsbacteria bacterium]